MASSLDYEKEIDAIRAKLYEESLSMPRDEWQKKISDTAHQVAQKYDFKIIPSKSVKRSAV